MTVETLELNSVELKQKFAAYVTTNERGWAIDVTSLLIDLVVFIKVFNGGAGDQRARFLDLCAHTWDTTVIDQVETLHKQ